MNYERAYFAWRHCSGSWNDVIGIGILRLEFKQEDVLVVFHSPSASWVAHLDGDVVVGQAKGLFLWFVLVLVADGDVLAWFVGESVI